MKSAKMFFVLAITVGLIFGCNSYYEPTKGNGLVHAVLQEIPVDAEVVPVGAVAIKEKVLFDFDSDKLDAEAQAIIAKVAVLLKKNPDAEIALAGHTDKYGSDEYNIGLSLRRSEAVANALVKLGVDKDKIIKVEGFGKQDLISKVNRENRRVIILSVE